jgi:ketosteroid isomerase-like protein
MTSNAARVEILVRALRARIEGDSSLVAELCTDDVRTWAPGWSSSSAAELVAELDRRDDAFSDLELEVWPLDVSGDYACIEWCVSMTHTGELTLPGDATVEPTGIRVELHGVTIAEFHDDRICAIRQYWDELAVLEQLGLLTRER